MVDSKSDGNCDRFLKKIDLIEALWQEFAENTNGFLEDDYVLGMLNGVSMCLSILVDRSSIIYGNRDCIAYRSKYSGKVHSFLRILQCAMVLKLEANDHKGGWENEKASYLFRRLDQELDEFKAVCKAIGAMAFSNEPAEEIKNGVESYL